MSIRPPQRPFRIEETEVSYIPGAEPKTVIQYVDVIKEVEKIVLKDDPALLEKFNAALKESSELRKKLNSVSTSVEPETKFIVETKVERVVVSDQKKELVLFIIALVIGVILCLLTKR